MISSKLYYLYAGNTIFNTVRARDMVSLVIKYSVVFQCLG